MKNSEKLSLAYQLQAQDPENFPDLETALVKVNSDEAFLNPPPAHDDIVATKKTVKNGVIIEHVNVLGDGSEVDLLNEKVN